MKRQISRVLLGIYNGGRCESICVQNMSVRPLIARIAVRESSRQGRRGSIRVNTVRTTTVRVADRTALPTPFDCPVL